MSGADLNSVARQVLSKEHKRLEEHIARMNREINNMQEDIRQAAGDLADLQARADQIVEALR